jgi:cobalt-zinc-cadmium efflux system protein
MIKSALHALRRHAGHGHDHGGGAHAHAPAPGSASQARLMTCFVLTAGFLVVEAATGLWTNSLALLSDAFHMLSDALALGLAALAARVSLRRPTPEKTFGFKRFEVLAAFANAVVLLVLGVGTAFSAIGRLWRPHAVDAGPMMIVAAAGLALNLVVLYWLHNSREEKNLNEESALWHVLGDALGSIAALAAGALMLWKGWMRADSIASLMISGLLMYGSVRVLRQSAHILVEGVPEGVDVDEVRAAMRGFPQVREVHDLHAWTLTGRDLYLSAHVDVESGALGEKDVVAGVGRVLKERFGIHHLTLQSGLCDAADCANDCH